MSTKMQKNIKEYMCIYILVLLCVFFVINIYMHIGVADNSSFLSENLPVQSYEGYVLQDNNFIMQTEDPQLYVTLDGLREVSSIQICFSQAIDRDMEVEVYYPDTSGNLSEQYMRRQVLPRGTTEGLVQFPLGTYEFIRLDINGSFALESIRVNGGQKIIFFNGGMRNKYYVFCLVFSTILGALLYRFKKARSFIVENVKKHIGKVRHFYSKNRYGIYVFVMEFIASIFLETLIGRIRGESFNVVRALIFFCLAWTVTVGIVFRTIVLQKIERAIFGLLLLYGIVYCICIPASLGISWDDQIHYARAYGLARIFNGTIMDSDKAMIDDFSASCLPIEGYTRESRNASIEKYQNLERSGGFTKAGYVFGYKHIAYVPYVLGIWISYGLCLPFTVRFIFVKIINFLFLSLFIYLAVRSVKSGKILILVFTMVPTFFFTMCVYDYDAWLIAGLIYAFCRYLGEVQQKEKRLTFVNFLGVFIPAFLALLPKIVYAPMLFLMAYMPKEKFKDRKWCIAYKVCFVFAALVVVAGVLYFASGRLVVGTGDARGGEGVNADMQIQYILANPGVFFSMLKSFLKGYLSYANSAQYLTFMAYMGLVNMPYIPIIILVLTALFDREGCDAGTVPILSRTGAVLMIVVIAGICATAMYISFTPVGLDTVNGCQGRYLLPVIFPSLYMVTRFGAFTGFRKQISIEIGNMAIIFVSVSFLMYNLWVNCAIKY